MAATNMVSVEACNYFNIYSSVPSRRCHTNLPGHGKGPTMLHVCEDCLDILGHLLIHPKLNVRCPIVAIYKCAINRRTDAARDIFPHHFGPSTFVKKRIVCVMKIERK